MNWEELVDGKAFVCGKRPGSVVVSGTVVVAGTVVAVATGSVVVRMGASLPVDRGFGRAADASRGFDDCRSKTRTVTVKTVISAAASVATRSRRRRVV
jgi:hypothetical protein